MSIPIFLAAADPMAAAEEVKQSVSETVKSLSQMSWDQFAQTFISGSLDLVVKILIAGAIFFIGRFLIRRLNRLLGRIMEKRNTDPSLRSFLQNLVGITLYLFLIIVVIGILGIDTTSFIAVFASAGLAVGMALSGTLQNFAGGVMILIFKPFRVGDFVEIQNLTGTVKEIQLFNTALNTPDNKLILLPNGATFNGIINNYSREKLRRVDWTFGIAYGDSYDKARQIIERLLEENALVLKNPAWFIALHSLGDSSVNLVVRAWAKTSDYWTVYFDMNEKVYKAFSEEGINIPFPQMDVHLHETRS